MSEWSSQEQAQAANLLSGTDVKRFEQQLKDKYSDDDDEKTEAALK
jgi:hypothetical protein